MLATPIRSVRPVDVVNGWSVSPSSGIRMAATARQVAAASPGPIRSGVPMCESTSWPTRSTLTPRTSSGVTRSRTLRTVGWSLSAPRQIDDGDALQAMRLGQLTAVADGAAVDDDENVAAVDQRIGVGRRPRPAGQFVGEQFLQRAEVVGDGEPGKIGRRDGGIGQMRRPFEPVPGSQPVAAGT